MTGRTTEKHSSLSQNKNYWFEAKDESTTEILLALEANPKARMSSQTKLALEPKEKLAETKQPGSARKPSEAGSLKEKADKVPKFKGVRGKNIRAMYSKMKVYNNKTARHEKFNALSNNFIDFDLKIPIYKTKVPTGMKGIYPNCLIYLQKFDMFVAGSNNLDAKNFLIFMRFKWNKQYNTYELDFHLNLPSVDRVTRIHSNPDDSFLILNFNNEYSCCLSLKTRRPGHQIPKEDLKGFCIWASNKHDMLMTRKVDQRARQSTQFALGLPVVSYLWGLKKGFYYKAVDFIYLDVNRLLKNKFWSKKIPKVMQKRLKKFIDEQPKSGSTDLNSNRQEKAPLCTKRSF